MYFFNLRSQNQIVQSQSEELPDNEAAWREATARIGELLRDLNDEKTQEFEFEVTDALKNRLYVISISSYEFAQPGRCPRDVPSRAEGVATSA